MTNLSAWVLLFPLLGFTILGASVGLSSYFPKLLIRRFGVRATIMAGAASLFVGFFCLSVTRGIGLLYLGEYQQP